MKETFAWLMENKEELAMTALTLIALAEMVVRLTPTKKDDGAVERVGHIVKKILDFFKLPNIKK